MPGLKLGDALVAEVLLYFAAWEDFGKGELTLDKVDERIDQTSILIQSLDVAAGNPSKWFEHLVVEARSADYLWPAERLMMFLLANYAALHRALRQQIDVILISPESIARELLALEWLPQEMTNKELLAMFLDHPASQVDRVG